MSKLSVRKIVKSFNGNPVLTDIQTEVQTGEILGVFGRNGSGKTTLLKILFGTLKADTEEVFADQELVDLSQSIPKQLISYLPQHSFLPKDITVRSAIYIYLKNSESINRVFYDHRIANVCNQKVGNLSAGELRYLEILLVANLGHSFILLDEPFSLIEPLYKEVIKEGLTNLKVDKGIIITDHYYRDVLETADRFSLLKDGRFMPIKNEEDLVNNGYLPGKS